MIVSKKKLLLAASIVGASVGTFYLRHEFSAVLDNACSTLAYPFLVVQHQITAKISAWQQARITAEELRTQLNTLQAEHDQLLSQIIVHNALETYAQAIEPLLAFKQRYNLEHAYPVHIIFTHIGPDEHYILIDGGDNCNFNDQYIAIKDNHLVGRVTHTYPYHSKVTLITDKRINIAAYCTKTKTIGIHSGTNRTHTGALQFVHHLQDLVMDDLVLSSGQGHVYPQGFCLGKIVFIQKKEVEYDVSTQPLIDLENLSYCLLVHVDTLHHRPTANTMHMVEPSKQMTTPHLVQHAQEVKTADAQNHAPCPANDQITTAPAAEPTQSLVQ